MPNDETFALSFRKIRFPHTLPLMYISDGDVRDIDREEILPWI